MKKLSSIGLWLVIFAILIAVQAYSALGQSEGNVIGSWKTGSVGSIQYQNQVTGATKPGRGSIFTYKFLPNGSYEYVGYMEITMYNCTNTLFNQMNGKYRVSGSTIELIPARDFWKSTNSCAASGNKQQTRTPTRKVLTFEARTDEYGSDLLCVSENGSETCYRREKE
jgi:hypothetical protein